MIAITKVSEARIERNFNFYVISECMIIILLVPELQLDQHLICIILLQCGVYISCLYP